MCCHLNQLFKTMSIPYDTSLMSGQIVLISAIFEPCDDDIKIKYDIQQVFELYKTACTDLYYRQDYINASAFSIIIQKSFLNFQRDRPAKRLTTIKLTNYTRVWGFKAKLPYIIDPKKPFQHL